MAQIVAYTKAKPKINWPWSFIFAYSMERFVAKRELTKYLQYCSIVLTLNTGLSKSIDSLRELQKRTPYEEHMGPYL